MKQTSTKLTSYCYFGGKAVIEFTESGFFVIEDSRESKTGYLHFDENSAGEITDAVRDQIIRYTVTHPQDLPGVGVTAQQKYFSGLTIKDIEQIGNDGKRVFWNA